MIKNLPAVREAWVRKILWRREWLPTPAFLPRNFHGQRYLVSYSLWGHKELDMTEGLTLSLSFSVTARSGSLHHRCFHQLPSIFSPSVSIPTCFSMLLREVFPVNFNINTWCFDKYLSCRNFRIAVSTSRFSHQSNRLKTLQLWPHPHIREIGCQQHYKPDVHKAIPEDFKAVLKKKMSPGLESLRHLHETLLPTSLAQSMSLDSHNDLQTIAPADFRRHSVSKYSSLRIWTNQKLALHQIINIWRHKKCLQRSNYSPNDKTLREFSIRMKMMHFFIVVFPSHSAVKPLWIVYFKDIWSFVRFRIWGVRCAAVNI